MEKLRVLVVDDEDPICKMVLRFLSMNNYEGDAAHNGKEALDMLKQKSYQVVLTDIKMPEMDGMSMMRVARDNYPNMVFIIMSGYGTLDSAIEAMKIGALNFIKKPISIVELIATIKKAEDILFNRDVPLRMKNYIRNLSKNIRITTRELHQNLDMVVNYLVSELKNFGMDKMILDNLTLALYEALTNAIEHGNLKLDKQISRDNTIEVFDNFLKEKLKKLEDPSLSGKIVNIDMVYGENKMEFIITDEGQGFNYKEYINKMDSNIYEDKLNKGLFLIKHVMDGVSFNDKGNQIRMLIKTK